MKKFGLIGGMGPESTIDYYNKIVYRYQKEHPKDYFPPIIIESVNIFEMLKLCSEKKYEELTSFLLKAIENVYAGGADFAALAANTPHIVFDRLKEKSPIPLISIVEETYKKVESDNIKNVGLLGTTFTMENDFFKKTFKSNGINIVVPDKEVRSYVNDKITKELEYGVVKKETKESFIKIIEELSNKENIEGIILGCTELPLLIKDDDIKEKVYDTVDIHVNSILDRIIG